MLGFDYCKRSCNECAHELAHLALNGETDQVLMWVDPFPTFVNAQLTADSRFSWYLTKLVCWVSKKKKISGCEASRVACKSTQNVAKPVEYACAQLKLQKKSWNTIYTRSLKSAHINKQEVPHHSHYEYNNPHIQFS